VGISQPALIEEMTRDRLVLREEWWHHRFAERDLSVVEAGI
jgi:hypothetical protein